MERDYTSCQKPKMTKVNRIMKWVFQIFMDSKKGHWKDKAEKESGILICLLVSLQDRGTCPKGNFRPHLDTKPDLGFWGKQGLHVLGLLAVSSMLAHFSKMNQNTVHSLFYSHHTGLPFYLQINASIYRIILFNYEFESTIYTIWKQNEIYEIRTEWKKTNQRYTALNTYCGKS